MVKINSLQATEKEIIKPLFVMKKILILFLWVLLIAQEMRGQTFHAVVFADTKDSMIGDGCFHDYERMTIELSTMASASDMKLKRYFYRNDDFSKLKLLEVLNGMVVEPQDVVVFYYTGHGARANTDESAFPQLALGSSAQDLMALEQVDAIIKGKNPRLRIVLADCCNAAVEGIMPQNQANGTVTQLAQAEVNTYQSLIRKLKGNVLLSSSSAGQLSIALPEGSIFTLAFLQELQKIVVRNGEVSWGELLDSTRERANNFVRQMTENRREQIAQYALNLTPINLNDLEPQVQQQAPPNQLPNELLYALLYVADQRKTENQRIDAVQPVLKSFFANSNAKIDIMGRNGTTLVDRFTAEQFVKHLAATKRLAQIVILDLKTDSQGKVTELKIHEIYKL